MLLHYLTIFLELITAEKNHKNVHTWLLYECIKMTRHSFLGFDVNVGILKSLAIGLNVHFIFYTEQCYKGCTFVLYLPMICSPKQQVSLWRMEVFNINNLFPYQSPAVYVMTCVIITIGLPLTLVAIYAVYSLVCALWLSVIVLCHLLCHSIQTWSFHRNNLLCNWGLHKADRTLNTCSLHVWLHSSILSNRWHYWQYRHI